MAIAHVQTVNQNGVASGTASVTLTLTAGNAVIVHLMRDGSVVAPTQGGSQDTLTQQVNVQGSGERCTQYTNFNVAGGSTTYSFTFTATNWRMVVSEFSGLDTAQTTPDASGFTAFATTLTANRVVATGATTQANELLIACWFGDGSGTTSVTSTLGDDAAPWTRPANGVVISGAATEFVVAYEIVSATGTYGCTLTTADILSCNIVLGTYKAAATATATLEWAQAQSQPTSHYRPDILLCSGALQPLVVPYLITTATRVTGSTDWIQPTVDVTWI